MEQRKCVDRCSDITYLPFVLAVFISAFFIYKTKNFILAPIVFIITWLMTWFTRKIILELTEGPSCPCRFF